MNSIKQHVLRESNLVQELSPKLLVGAYIVGVFIDISLAINLLAHWFRIMHLI